MNGIDQDGTRFVFVTSYGRSGSTILSDMLSRHPDVGFVSNLDDRFRRLPSWWQRCNPTVYHHVPQRFTRKGRVLRFAPSEGWRLLEAEVSSILAGARRPLTAEDASPWLTTRLRDFFTSRAAVQRRLFFVHKLTGWPHVGLLRVAFPDARFVHVVRDGRAVADSDLRTTWWPGFAGPHALLGEALSPEDEAAWVDSDRSYAVLAALVWRLAMRETRAARATVPSESWMDVRFEDLLSSRELVFERMGDFLGLPARPSFDAWVRRTVLDEGRQDGYRRHLPATTVGRVESAIGDELAAWGYLETAAASA